MGNRDVGFTYKPRKATVAPIIRGQDDWRSTHLRNTAIQRANEVRKQRSTFDDPNWIMAQSPETMLDRDFMSKAKPAMVAMQGNKDFYTTDRDEKRNLYQMWLNNMVGGGGARMLDLRGLPSVVQRNPNKYRRGRTLFEDPSKSAGFGANLRNMLGDLTFQDKRLPLEKRTSNPAAVRATEYNPFHKEGYGRDFYIDEFGKPLGEKLKGIMKLALPGPLKFLQGKEREPLPSDRSWIPENVGAYNEIPEIPFKDNLSYEPETTRGPEGDPSIMMAGMEPEPFFSGYDDSVTITDLEDITDAAVGDGLTIEAPPEIEESKFSLGNLADVFNNEDYSTSSDLNIQKIQDSTAREAAERAALNFYRVYREGSEGMPSSDDSLENLYQVYVDAILDGRLIDAGISEPQ